MTTLHHATSALVVTIKQLAQFNPELRCINLDEVEAALAADRSTKILDALEETAAALERAIQIDWDRSDPGCMLALIAKTNRLLKSVGRQIGGGK